MEALAKVDIDQGINQRKDKVVVWNAKINLGTAKMKRFVMLFHQE